MNSQRSIIGRAIGAVVILGALGLLAVTYFAGVAARGKGLAATGPELRRVTLSGTYVCLPRTDASTRANGCVSGLKTDSGAYYGIDFALMSSVPDRPPAAGNKISANGVLVPVSRSDADRWRGYPVTEVFSATDSLKILR